MTEKETLIDGLVEEFYDDGQLESRGNYKNGKPVSLHETFYENGQTSVKGVYKNDLEDGIWKHFDEEGNLITIEEWKDGELIK